MLQMRGRLPRPPELRGPNHRGAKGEPHDSDDSDYDDDDDDDDQVSVMLGKCGLSVGTCDKECAVLTVQGDNTQMDACLMLSNTCRRAHELRVRVRAERGHVSPGEPRVPARAVRVPVQGHGGQAPVS